MRYLLALAAIGALVPAAPAQTPAQLRHELKSREAAAKDADALLAVARWAKEKGLMTDHKRLLNKVIKQDPNNEAAMTELGYVRFKGEWMLKDKADMLRMKEAEAAFKAQGMKEVDGVWVAKTEVADAKKGRFFHDGQRVSREDKLAFQEGKVRHPATGAFILRADLPKAEKGLYPIENGRWVSENEANEYHADPRHPWLVRSNYATVVTTLPMKDIAQVKSYVDDSFDIIKPLFGGEVPDPKYRPYIIVCGTIEEYNQIGTAIGAEHSAYGAFVAQKEPAYEGLEIPTLPAVANWGEQNWGPYYVRHAAGLAYAHAMCEQVGAEIPYWITCGVGSLAERHATVGLTKFFGQQHIAKGGVKDLKDWFADFEISPNLQPKDIGYNVYQAGLLLAYCMRGGDAKATAALQGFTAAFQKNGRAVEKAAQKLERTLMGSTEGVRAYLKDCIQKG